MDDIRDVDDALAYGLTVRDAMEAFEAERPGSVIFAKPPTPTRARPPGEALHDYLTKQGAGVLRRMKGGQVAFGDYDCSRCGREFYMEVGFDAQGVIVDSVGGVIYDTKRGIMLCDECSPL